MAVARSSSGTQFIASGGYVTTLSLTTFGVSNGSDLALYAGLGRGQLVVTTPTFTWNGVSMALVQNAANSEARADLARLVAPATGTQTLSASWTTAAPATLGAAAFSGVDQTTPEAVGDTLTATGNSAAPATGAITSATGDATLGLAVTSAPAGNGTFTTPEAFTSEYRVTTGHEAATSMSSTLGGTSNNHTFTSSPSNPWAAIGIHIKAAAAGGAAAIPLMGQIWQ